ncbi:MAG: universal stress protein [bacterium]
MSKRIVVGLDPSEYSHTALKVACARARIYDGTVVGVGIIDLPGIEAAGHGAGVGASHFAKKAREHHIKEAEETVGAMLDAFERICKEHDVTSERVLRTGSPADVIADEAKAADLIIIGAQTFFHFETERKAGDTLDALLKAQACPVMVVPEELKMPVRRVIFPYDGSEKAARSMRSFVNLTDTVPMATDALLLRVEEDVEVGLESLESPTKYLRAWGYDVETRVVPGDAREVILEVARENMPAMVVLGVSGKSSLRVFLFGSVTHSLLEDGTIPLFVTS